MAKIDLSKFKKVASDGKTTTLKHQDGHSITVVHAALSPKFREQLASIPTTSKVQKFADGGEAQPDDQTPPAPQAPVVINVGGGAPQLPPSAINPNAGQGSQMGAPIGQSQTSPGDLPYGVTPEQQQPAVTNEQQTAPPVSNEQPKAAAPTQQPPSDPYGTGTTMDAFQKGAGEYKAGLAQQAAAEGQAANAQANVAAQGIAQQKAAQATYQNTFQQLDSERKALQQDVQNGHIDPKHYWSSLSTGDKVMKSIGLILGGISGGILHRENPVAKYLAQQVENDLQAQKAELGKKENLLSANMRQFGNLKDATDMTRIMQNDQIANGFKEAAAKAGSQEAKGRLLVEAGKFDAQNAQAVGQMAMRKSLLTGMSQGQVAPERVITALVPEHDRQAAYKELQSAQNMAKTKDNALSAFDEVNNMTLGGALSPHKRDAIIEPILAQMVKDSEGRITPQDTKMIAALFPQATDLSDDTRQTKRVRLNQFLSEKMNYPMLQTYGITPQSFGRYNSQGQSKIQERPPTK